MSRVKIVPPKRKPPPLGVATSKGAFCAFRPAKASPFGRGGTEGDGEGKPGTKEPLRSDGQALCQSDTIAVSGIRRQRPSPLSRACARQLPQRGSPWQAGPLPTGCPRPDMAQKGGPCYRGPRPAGCERQRSRRWEPQPGLLLVISVLHPLSSRNTRSLALNPDIRPFQSFLFCATSGTLLFTGMKRLFLPAVSCFLMKTPPCS